MRLQEQIAHRHRLPPPQARRALRMAAGVSLAAVAKEVGVEPSTIMRWEEGTRTPRDENLARYLAALDVLRGSAA